MLILILAILLLVIVVHYMPQREGATNYQEYNEQSCQSLAKQNQNNIEGLQKDVKKILDLENKVKTIENLLESNKTQLKSLTDQVYKMPN
jgi:uncharacterized protein HemX